jgi:hypothetical protein
MSVERQLYANLRFSCAPSVLMWRLVFWSHFGKNAAMIKCAGRPCFIRAASGVLLAACVGLAGTLFAQEVARVFLKGPYLQGPGTDTMTIKWEAATNTPSIVRYGLKGKAEEESRVERPRHLDVEVYNSVTNVSNSGETNITRVPTTNVVYLYEATLTNLRPDSVYTYWAETDSQRTPAKKFKTFAIYQGKVTFIGYGDARTNPKIHSAVTANFKRYAPDFILHTGDLVADGRRYDVWGREFFDPLANVLDEVPILPSIGNHEQDGNKYLFYLALPGKGRWYSYDIGPVHVVALDFRYDKETDEQFAFARQDLMASKAPWKVVFLHYPVFNIGGHATGWGHATYLPLFHRAKVDLVVTGHSHIYERFLPIAGQSGEATWPITHITTGGGGAPLAASYPHPALVANYATNHFVVFEATATTLKARAISTNNTVLDTFELKKRNGRPEPSYLAQVYPEEALKLFYEATPSLTGSLASAPGTNSAAPAMFTIRPLKTIEQTVQVEISLTKDSARSYELEGGPFRVTIPSVTESNKIVWARVKATGNGAGDGRAGGQLSPALMFQGRMQVGGVETVAYGQRCRVSDSAAEAASKLGNGR